jgi:outer membrane protein assembly factor BamB
MAAAAANVGLAPAVADGVIYVPTSNSSAELAAYSVNCAQVTMNCLPQWTADSSWIASSPVIANGFVYVGSSVGSIGAYPVACATGAGTCDTSCPGNPGAFCAEAWQGGGGNIIYGSPAIADGTVYVGSDLWADAFDAASCASKRGSCDPLWRVFIGNNGTRSSPAAADGMVYFGSEDGRLYAFAVGCANPHRACTPGWTAPPTPGFDLTPCADTYQPCHPLWTAVTKAGIDSSPAVANGVVYVGSRDGNLYAYGIGCPSGSPCTPLWTATPGAGIDSSPTVANGVVYVASRDGRLYAYAVGCANDGGTCTPLWSADIGGSSALPTSFDMSPVVANGAVYVGSYDGNVYAFSLYGATPPATSTSASQPPVDRGTPTLVVALGLAAFLAGTFVTLSRNKRPTLYGRRCGRS